MMEAQYQATVLTHWEATPRLNRALRTSPFSFQHIAEGMPPLEGALVEVGQAGLLDWPTRGCYT